MKDTIILGVQLPPKVSYLVFMGTVEFYREVNGYDDYIGGIPKPLSPQSLEWWFDKILKATGIQLQTPEKTARWSAKDGPPPP